MLRLLVLLFAFLPCSTLFAEIDNQLSDRLVNFEKLLSDVENQFNSRELGIDAIKTQQSRVADTRSIIAECIDSNETAIAKTNQNLSSLGELLVEENTRVTETRNSLQETIIEHDKQLATCRLLNIRVNQLIEEGQNQLQQLIAAQLLTRQNSVIENIEQNVANPLEGLNALLAFGISTAGFDVFYQHRFGFAVALFMGIILTIGLRQVLARVIRQQAGVLNPSFARSLSLSLLTALSHYLLSLILIGGFAVYFFYQGYDDGNPSFITLLVFALFLYVILNFVLRLILNPVAPASRIIDIPEKHAVQLSKRLRILSKILFLGFLFFAASFYQQFPLALTGLLRNIYVSLIILNLCWAFWLLGHFEGLTNSRLVRSGIIFALLCSLVAEWIGYTNFSNFILVGISGSIVVWLLAHSVANIWTDFLDSFDDGEFAWQKYLRRKIGVKSGENLPGSLWFRFIFSIVLWSGFAIIMMKIWGLSDRSLLIIRDLVVTGFNIGPVQVVPSKVIIALLLFALLLSLLGWIKRRLDKSWLYRSRMDRGSKESLITLTGYIGVVLAFLIGLSVAGVELSNLALIAGALSVGIGFGLQNVVNNFVSGIVMLFERPVKTGDWVVVGAIQGYVKKIKLRSTVVQTFDRADIIVPNSEFISNQVTNWMLNDPIGRVKVPIRAAFGSDPRLVEKILLDIAHNHPMCIGKSNIVEAPKVIFMSVGDSALNFELRFFITEVDYYMGVLSDVNFNIIEKFSEHNIHIPFPQSDLHLKSGFAEIERPKLDKSDE